MRDSGLVSTGPNCEKSMAGMTGRPPPPPAGARATAGAGAANELFTNPLTSSCVIRPLKPLPLTRVRSTPSSRANLRTDGPACAAENPGSLMGGRLAFGAAGAGDAGFAGGVAPALAGVAAAELAGEVAAELLAAGAAVDFAVAGVGVAAAGALGAAGGPPDPDDGAA